jgi:MFS family permease
MAFPAFRHRNFRLFWSANVVSLIGTLAQDAARGWLLAKNLNADAFTVSLVAACSTAPILLFTLYAGAVADRVNKTRGLFLTNCAALLLAFAMYSLIVTDSIQVWHVAVIAALVGLTNAFDIPIRQSMNIEMVGREDLPNAIALNSTAFNGARVLGPAVGGYLIQAFGTANCFLLNALSFIPLLVNLRRMDLPTPELDKRRPSFEDIKEGFYFVRMHPILWPVTVLVAIASIFALSFSNLMPIFAKDVFKTDERGFAFMLSSSGLGAVTAAGSLALAGKMRHKGKRLLGGAFAFCIAVAGFAYSPSLPIACAFLFASGYCLLTFLTTANTIVQVASPDELRGRVFSLYSLALIGSAPLGALFVGSCAQLLGTREGVFLGAVLGGVWTLGTFFYRREIWKEK